MDSIFELKMESSGSHGSPSRESNSSARISMIEDTLPRDFSLVSLNSTASQDEFFRCRDHANEALKKMQSYLESEKLCDVILIAGLDGTR